MSESNDSHIASILWRLRRATTMETGLFEIQAEHLRDYREITQLLPRPDAGVHATLGRNNRMRSDSSAIEVARCFLHLANLPNFVLDRLSRYEAMPWRQASRILLALDALDRRKPQELRRRSVLCANPLGD